MADLKISELTNLTAADPVSDMLPIVDVSATPPASGSTKRISINNLLSSSPTASGALTVTGLVTAGSAAITGAATVGTTLGVTGATTLTGNVGIGVAPGLGLDIYKPSLTGFTNLPANVAFSDSTAMAAGVGGGVFFQGRYDGTTNVSVFGVISGVKENGTASNFAGALVFGTRDAGGGTTIERMRINSTGNIVMKTASTGIDFSIDSNNAGATSEILNDYEEGTFTPGITFGGASVGMTGTFSGRYTKVGRAVTVNGIITLTAKGSSTGDARITGLPFTSANAAGEYTAVSLRLDRISFLNVPCGYVGPNVSVVNLEQITIGGTVTPLTDANFINTSVLIVNFTYTV
jgi:hypothetical protein